MTESKLNGQKLFGSVGSLSPFCNSFIRAVFSVIVSFPFVFIWFIPLVISSFRDGQKMLRNLTVKPSTLGAELGSCLCEVLLQAHAEREALQAHS